MGRSRRKKAGSPRWLIDPERFDIYNLKNKKKGSKRRGDQRERQGENSTRFHNSKEKAHGDDIDQGRLAAILKSYESELHLLLPEETLEPVQERVNQRSKEAHLDQESTLSRTKPGKLR